MRAASPSRVVRDHPDLCWPLAVGDVTTVTRARALVTGALAMLGLPRTVIDDAETMTGELVGNAVQHACPPVELRVCAPGALAEVSVFDGSVAMPVFPPSPVGEGSVPDDTGEDLDQMIVDLSEFGRGLALVQHLSGGRCGAHHTPGGKAVWFEAAFEP